MFLQLVQELSCKLHYGNVNGGRILITIEYWEMHNSTICQLKSMDPCPDAEELNHNTYQLAPCRSGK